MSISPRVELGAPKISMFEILWCIEMGNLIHFGAQHCQKYALDQNFYLKLFLIWCVFLAALTPKLNVFFCYSIK